MLPVIMDSAVMHNDPTQPGIRVTGSMTGALAGAGDGAHPEEPAKQELPNRRIECQIECVCGLLSALLEYNLTIAMSTINSTNSAIEKGCVCPRASPHQKWHPEVPLDL